MGKEIELRQNRGAVEGYKKFNKTTRNIGIGVFAGSLLLGAGGVASVAALSVAVDQGQLLLIDKYQKGKEKKAMQKMARSGVIFRGK